MMGGRLVLKSMLFKFLCFCVLIIGLFFLFSKQIQNIIVKSNTQKFSIVNYTSYEIDENKRQTEQVTFDFDAVKPISTEAVLKAQLDKNGRDYPVVAGILIPSVDLNLPIFMGLANENLLWGAGTLSETQEMGSGNYALASHLSYDPDTLFSPLSRTSPGEKIYLNDLNSVYEYTIYLKEWVSPDATHVLDEVPGETIVTLITCGDYDATNRLIIQGSLTAVTPIDEISNDLAAAFY